MPELNDHQREEAITSAAVPKLIALAVAVFVTLTLFYGNFSSEQRIPIDGFFAEKYSTTSRFDLVFAGDSRTYRGINPSSFKSAFPDLRALNFGFSSAALTESYLDAAHAKLDPSSPKKIIVIGVTPYSLTQEAARENGFRVLDEMPAIERFNLASFESAYSLLHRAPAQKPIYHQIRHSNGWIESSTEPERPNEAIKLYRDRFAHHKVDPRLVESLLQKVSSWTKNGILVYGVRIPSSRDMENLEDRSSGLDYVKFSRKFREVGGFWIESDGVRYYSYDGSHLRGDAATQYSAWLAETMKTGVKN